MCSSNPSSCLAVHVVTCLSLFLFTYPLIFLPCCAPVNLSSCLTVLLSSLSSSPTTYFSNCLLFHLPTSPAAHVAACPHGQLFPVSWSTCPPASCPAGYLFSPVFLYNCQSTAACFPLQVLYQFCILWFGDGSAKVWGESPDWQQFMWELTAADKFLCGCCTPTPHSNPPGLRLDVISMQSGAH